MVKIEVCNKEKEIIERMREERERSSSGYCYPPQV
jgi:hypothetical protein